MDDASLESLLAAWTDGTLDADGERELCARLRAASPAERSAAARNALVGRLLRIDARGPLDAGPVLRALPARSRSRLASRVMRSIDETSCAIPRDRARARRRLPRDRRWGPFAAAMILVTVTVGAFLFVRDARVAPAYALHVEGTDVRRGEMVYAADGPLHVDLGGYCRLRLEPTSALRILGRRKAEHVFLERGRLACEVTPGRGAFSVRTEVGTVVVQGTAFEMALENVDPGRPAAGRRLVVDVASGAVRLKGPAGTRTVRAGETAVVDPAVAAGPYGPDGEGFLKHWLLLEPIRREGWTTVQTEAVMKPLLDGARLPGAVRTPRAGDRVAVGGKSLAWRPHALGSWWAADLEAFAQSVHGPEDQVFYHGVTYVICDRPMPDLRLAIGSDDSSAWRLNGREVLRLYSCAFVGKDMRTVPVSLRQGVNVLAFTVFNRDGPTAVCARFLDAGGAPVRDYTVTLTPPAETR